MYVCGGRIPFTVIAAIAIGVSKREILFEKLPLDLTFMCMCMCVCVSFQMGGKCCGKMEAVSQPNETNVLRAHTHTHTQKAIGAVEVPYNWVSFPGQQTCSLD